MPGGLPTEALIAQIRVAKFGDHLPFYRQAEIYARQGIRVDRASFGNWADYSAAKPQTAWQATVEDLARSPPRLITEILQTAQLGNF